MEKGIDIIISVPPPQVEVQLPVWDNYVKNIAIDYRIIDPIANKISDLINLRYDNLFCGYPCTFSSRLKGELENILNEVEKVMYLRYGLTYTKLVVVRRSNDYVIRPPYNKPFKYKDESLSKNKG